jgi:glycosyltransferase involved in cell wall biosynthesis
VKNISHLTSVHPRFDTRIFHKMCRSLANQGFSVNLVVADGKGDETREGVKIFDAGASKGRFDRISNAPGRVFVKALALNADLYHLHDPELIPIGLKLKKLGKRVIFDSHEDVPRQMLTKPYLNRPMRWGIAQALRFYEAWACKKFDGVITATPSIRDKFLSINSNSVDINNFPLLDELASATSWVKKEPVVCYVGGIGKIRGIVKVTQAMELLQSVARLQLAGQFGEKALQDRVQALPGWQRVDALGFVDRTGVRDVLARSMAGLVTFLPAPNHIDAQPNKMFEYMSAGIPVIASDFPLWREIIAGNDCGLLVDPLDPVQIAEAIDYLVTHPDEAERMGRNGRRAVLEQYNWPTEEKKLLGFYERVLKPNISPPNCR